MPTGLEPSLLLVAELSVRLALIARVLLHRRHTSATRLAWCAVLAGFPLGGSIAYVLVGEVRLGGRRRKKHEEIVELLRETSTRHAVESQPEESLTAYLPTMALAERAGGIPARRGHEIEIFGESTAVIQRLIQDIDIAESHCHLLFYIWLDDDSGKLVARALERAVGRGVACRVLVDDVGSREFLRSATCEHMQAAGVQVVGALPAHLIRVAFSRLDVRNHRKIAVIDGQTGWTGSQNIANASFAPKPRFAPWVDCMLRVRGPAVRDLQEIFAGDWFTDTDESLEELLALQPELVAGGVSVQVVPSGPGHDPEVLHQITQAACHQAREEILITTPYFVPGAAETAALCTAALRGVRTVLVVPKRNDSILVGAASRSRYSELLEAGVEIHEYTKGLLHAKTLTVDRRAALVGTANFDRRSFELNFEVSVLLYDSDLASRLRFLQRSYMADAIQVSVMRWGRRSWFRRFGQNAADLLSPLL